MNRSNIWRYVGILAFNLLFAMPALSQFQQGTLINIGAKGISNKYDFKDTLHLGDLTVAYQQVGEYHIDEGSNVLIVYSGGLMQNFEYSKGKIRITEKIIVGDVVIPREIIYEDGIFTVNVTSTKHSVKQGVYIDLNSLWLTLRQEKTIPELCSQMSSKDSKLRLEAVKVLANLRMPTFSSWITFSLLIIALKDIDADIRECAAIALGKRGDACAVKPLILSLTDKIWYVRWRVAWALGQMKGKEQVGPLTEALKKEKDEFARETIAKTLQKINKLGLKKG